ncbi:MAG: DUF6599 family protein, partial [Terriglobia bacterium]
MRAMWQRRRLFCFSFFLLLARPAHANLPDSFNGWQTKSFHPIPASRLAFFAGDDAPLLHEYGFVSGQRREYARDDATLTVTLWQLRDATGSYGLFTFYRDEGMDSEEGEDAVVARPGRWLARRSLYVVEARGTGLSRAEAAMLLDQIPPVRPTEEVLPMLPAYLPLENLIPSSSKFLLGPVGFARLEENLRSSSIGFDLGAEAILARYRAEGATLRMLLVSYATPQLAARQLRSFQELPSAGSTSQPLRNIYIRRKGSLLGFVLDAPLQATAEKLLDGIRYESVVTWNERVPSPRDNVGNLMMAAFLLTGFLLLVTLVAGISFGGVRYLAKRFLPWAVFD